MIPLSTYIFSNNRIQSHPRKFTHNGLLSQKEKLYIIIRVNYVSFEI